MEKLRGNWKHQTQDILWRFCRGITRDRFLHKSTFSLIWNLTVRNDWAQSLKSNAMIMLTSDPVFCAHSENTSYPNHHDGVRFGTLIFSFWFFWHSIIWYHMIWWHMIGGGVVWCAWYAYLFYFFGVLGMLKYWNIYYFGAIWLEAVWFGLVRLVCRTSRRIASRSPPTITALT